jgi:hypothetical protein
VRALVAFLVAGTSIGAAHYVRGAAEDMRPHDLADAPYAPSPAMAPIVSLGYRELTADVLWIRFVGYVGTFEADASAVGDVVEAIAALDPGYRRIYETGARAMAFAQTGVQQTTTLRAIAILEEGMARFPNDWKIPDLAGDMYIQDLVTTDPAQRRAWDERGVLLIESAIRKPGAPVAAATYAATMRTKLGQQERAIANLREMILITSDDYARQRMIDKLSKMIDANKDAVQAELDELRGEFMRAWRHDRPDLPPTLYVLVGPRRPAAFDLADLATGGRDLRAPSPEPLEPLD